MFKKLGLVAFFATLLTACINTQQMNQKASEGFSKTKQDYSKAIDTTSTTSKRIHAVFNRMKPYAEKANKTGVPFQWEIIVLRLNELNAWAMAGGKMAFYTGLVDQLNMTDDEIATVMGHEMAHALEEHSKSGYNFNMATGVLGSVADALATAALGTDTNGLLTTGVDLIANKPFSRSQETEADEIGLMLMAQSGYNPSQAPNIWVKMSQTKGNSGPSIFSTHPSNAERQKNLERLIPKAMEVYNGNKG